MINKGFGMVPVAGVEPARVISPTDFESASSANSNTPAHILLPASEKDFFGKSEVFLEVARKKSEILNCENR